MDKILYVIVHNIRSAYNVGSVFRTADSAGVKKIYLSGYTPTPYDCEKEAYPTKAQKMIAKTALGAEKYVLWEKVEDVDELISRLKEEKTEIVALEQDDRSVNVYKYGPNFPCALVLGSELGGVDKEVLKKADRILEISMKGEKESLNVSVAAGIAIYHILK